jgi:hypothetical protein
MNIQTNSFPTDFYRHLEDHTLTGIKAGKDRTTFLNIWMVNVEGRVFARSWGKSNRSWFTTLLDEKAGQIKYGDKVLNITATPCKDALMNTKIDRAYRTRYTTPENLPYAIGITQPEYTDYTMEFLLDQL